MASINQAAYVPGSTTYRFGYNSIPNMPITGAPGDANLARWSMLHDGSDYRLYCFKGSTNNTLYQFAWNGSSYEFGYKSIKELTLTNMPEDADASSASMLFGDGNYRCYLRKLGDPTTLYQFAWVNGTAKYEWGQGASIPSLSVTDFPDDTDWSRWSMLNDGSYRIYAMKLGSNTEFYQGSWNGSSYQFGHNSIKTLTLEETPSNSNLASMSMLHDGSAYRFYLQTV